MSDVIVYVESNFVLELALLQEEHEACQEILSLAEQNRIQLLIPAYSLIEPYETRVRRSKRRDRVAEEVRGELNQLGRSAPYKDEVSALDELTRLLIRSQEEEAVRLNEVLNQLLTTAELIPLTSEIISSSLEHQANGLKPQDAVVYASVLHHLKAHEGNNSVFLNRDKDFQKYANDPEVQDTLDRMGCKLLTKFDIGHIKHILNR